MFARIKMFAVAACLFAAPAAFGQVMYNGWNLGPDYGAMANQAIARQNDIVNQATVRAEESVHWAMNQPQCAEMYRVHQAQGGQLSYRDFAYQFAATAGGSAEGKARYFGVEQSNQAKEHQAWVGYQGAVQNNTAAVQGWQSGWSNIQNEQGNLLMGNSTYTDHTGAAHVLPHTQPNTLWYNQGTGNGYIMDNTGNYYMSTPSGYWYGMQPGR